MSGLRQGEATPAAAAHAGLAARYGERARRALTESILPFWHRTIDDVRGGIFNCWSNDGTRLMSRDKFTWSQGRFAWLWSRLSTLADNGLLHGAPRPEEAERYRAQAGRTVRFLEEHAFLPDGRCAFLLSESGQVKEAIAGAGPAPSLYADCFVVMGFAEHARVSGDRAVLDAAWRLFQKLEQRIAVGGFPTHPEPIPPGFESHAVAMITLNVSLVLREACEALDDPRRAEIELRCVAAANKIFETFMLPGGRIVEMRPRERSAAAAATLLARHLNPGHALEGLWMLLGVAHRLGRGDWLERANEAVLFSLERGWDETHGGLLHYVDADGGPPTGTAGDSVYERGVRATWDAKLWWIHSEALYTTALCHQLTGDPAVRVWFERVWDYAFRVFPHPDPAIGEWIQIRDRSGAPLERVVALPVKDPYHIARNLIQLVELFGAKPGSVSA